MTALALLVALAAPGLTTVEQVGKRDEAVESAPQAAAKDMTAPDVADRSGGLNVDTVQLNRSTERTPLSAQVTRERGTGRVDQLARRERSTESAPSLSRREQGFETNMVRVEGSDRCSAELLSARDRTYCQQVIENRAAEFAGPRPAELTLEQRLLIERNRAAGNGTDSAIRRLANGRETGEEGEEQAIASVVLAGQDTPVPPSAEDPAKSNLSAETQALLDAIVKNLGGNPNP